jgi:hypothetical protein
MSEGLNRERWERIVAEPFVPAHISGTTTLHVSAEYRVAAALEYIAAQLGEMNMKLSKLVGEENPR